MFQIHDTRLFSGQIQLEPLCEEGSNVVLDCGGLLLRALLLCIVLLPVLCLLLSQCCD